MSNALTSAYRSAFDAVITGVPAESAHHATMTALKTLQAVPSGPDWVRSVVGRPDLALTTEVFGRVVPSPVGLAAGFDKNAVAIDALGAFGFGFVEVGTITGQPQPGNPRPRLFRLPADDAIINRMGFNNDGSAEISKRLHKRSMRGASEVMLGVNIGKTKVVPTELAVADYVASASRLAAYADYMVVNVSSPNTPGLRDLQAVESLRPLLAAVRDAARQAAHRDVPVLVKIAPDLADEDVLAVADVVVSEDLAGVVATNTTISRDGLRTPLDEVAAFGAGGLSGPVLRQRSRDILRTLRDQLGADKVIISVGGIADGAEAFDRLMAGATLVQAYTALVYGGPAWPSAVNTQLVGTMRQRGFTTLAEARAAHA